jgi:hypothetical protein
MATSNTTIVDRLLELKDKPDKLHNVWRSDEDICRILKSNFFINITTKRLNYAVSSDGRTSATVDLEKDNKIGVWRCRHKIQNDNNLGKTRMYFYFIRKKKNTRTRKKDHTVTPLFITDASFWQKVYEENRLFVNPAEVPGPIEVPVPATVSVVGPVADANAAVSVTKKRKVTITAGGVPFGSPSPSRLWY